MREVKHSDELMTLKDRDTKLKRHWLSSLLWITFPLWSVVLLYLGMKYFGVDAVRAASGLLLFIGAAAFLIGTKPIFAMQNIPFLVRLILVVSYCIFFGPMMIFLYVWPLAG